MKKCRLGDYIISYGDGIHGTPEYDIEGKYWFINGNNLNDGKIIIDEDTKRISKKEYESIKRKLSNQTILISINGTMGKIAYYQNEPVALGKSVCYLNVKKERSKEFIRYVLETDAFKKYINLVAHGSTIKNLAPSQIVDYTFDGVENEKKVGLILSKIDDKIDVNNHLNETLEAMAKTLYDYWFVQFDFPDEHGRPYKTSGGSMTYNEELGREIPTGWEVIPLKSIADYNNSLKEVVLSENYIGIDNMLPNMKGVTPSTYDVPAGSIIGFEKRDILIGNIRPYFKKIWLADFNGGCSPDVLVLHANIDSLTEFVYSSLANDTFFDYDTKGAKGTKMPRGDKAHIMSFPIAFNQKLAKKFSGIVQNMFIKKGQNVVENCYLTQLRDFLLPLLMNGQVTFK